MEQMITVEQLEKELLKKSFYIPKDVLYMLYSALHQKPVAGAFLFGPAGVGKTELAQTIGSILNTEVFYFQMFPNIKEDDLLIRHVINEDGDPVATDGVLIEAAKFLQNNPNRKATIILDEYDKARPSADNFMLDFLQNGRIRYAGRKYDVDLSRIYMFITSNEFREFSEPFMRRLPRIDMKPLSPELVVSILRNRYKVDNEELLKLAHLLYSASLEVNLKKPVTVQELNQFILACSVLKDKADIESLIFSYLIKDPEDYEIFINGLRNYTPLQYKDRSNNNNRDVSKIIENKISETLKEKNVDTELTEEFVPKFPKIFYNINEDRFPNVTPALVLNNDEEEYACYGVIDYSEAAYHALSNLFINMDKSVNGSKFDDVFSLIEHNGNKYIVQNEVLDISEHVSSDESEFENSMKKLLNQLSDKNSIWLVRREKFIPFSFRKFVKFLLKELESYSSLKSRFEVVYLSEKEKQMRIKINDYNHNSNTKTQTSTPVIDSFIYVDNENEIINEMVIYRGHSGGDELCYYNRCFKNALEKLLREINNSKIKIDILKGIVSEAQLNLQREAENFLRDKIHQYKFNILLHDKNRFKVLEIDIQEYLERICNKVNKDKDIYMQKEIESLLNGCISKVYVALERTISGEKINKMTHLANGLSYVVVIPNSNREILRLDNIHVNLNKISVDSTDSVSTQDIKKIGAVKKEKVKICLSEGEHSLEGFLSVYLSEKENMDKFKKIIVPIAKKYDNRPSFRINIFCRTMSSLILSYEGMESIALYEIVKNVVDDIIVSNFCTALDKTIKEFQEENKILSAVKNTNTPTISI